MSLADELSCYEQHSEDGQTCIGRTMGRTGWGVWWDGREVAGSRTREGARSIMRALKADPSLVPALEVLSQ